MVGQELVLKGVLDAEYGRFYSQLFSKRETGDYEDFINHDLKTVESLFPVARICCYNRGLCEPVVD